MAGSIGAAYYLVNLPQIGGMEALITHENVADKLSILPDFNDTEALITLLIIPLTVQWWSSWYPGAEPGGGGYIAQRMLAAKDENHAIGATFFFNIMHYALRPWPWILVALASLIIFPDIASIQEAFPNITSDKLGDDLAYSAMLTKLPSGLLGLVLASLIAAYMSTISTHLNWGSSYIVNDFYKQHVKKDASEKHLVLVGRISTVLLMVFSALFALYLQSAKQLFDIIIMFGAGTGLIFILRWFWWRINAWSEISAMIISGIISLIFSSASISTMFFGDEGFMPTYAKLPIIVLITTVIWLLFTFVTKPEKQEVLLNFYNKTQPGGPGWKLILQNAKENNQKIIGDTKNWNVPSGILAMLLGCVLIYSCLFATGYWIYGEYKHAILVSILAILSGIYLLKMWKKIKKEVL
jgi:Na+/proline symporter